MVAAGRPAAIVRSLAAGTAILVAFAACDAAGPRTSAQPTAPSTARDPFPTSPLAATATLAPSPIPSPPAVATAATTPAPVPPLGPVELHFLHRDYVPGSELRSAEGQILWSGGPATSTRVWRYVPGAAKPEIVVDVPRRGSTISDVGASAAGFAFVETNAVAFGLGGWRIWFVEAPGAALVELDRGVAYGAGFPPTLAMDDRRIAWAAFDEPPSGDVSVLRTVRIKDLGAVTTLIELPVRDGLLWLPALLDDELWYAIIHPDWGHSGAGDEFHVELLDLASNGSAPVRFGGTANDFSPAVSESHIAWKTAVDDGAALNWGNLTVQERATSTRWTVPIDDLKTPSLGTRFLAFEEITRSRLAVFDLSTHAVADLLPSDLAGEVHVGGQSISGSLLTFYTQEPGGLPRIGWATLPE